MTSAISSSTSSYGMHRPDPSQLASKLFSKLDTKNQGYIEKSDLQSAFDQIVSGTSADEVFKQLDSDSDGKVTQDEMSSSLAKLAEQLDNRFQQSRMSAAGGMPPPPLPEDDAGFTKDELQSQLDEVGSTDSKRSSLISNIVSNFDKADTDSDGKVSFQEAMAYDQKSKETTATDTDSGNSATSSSNDAAIMHRIMQLMHAYGSFGDDSSQSSTSSLLSTTA